MCLNVLFIKNIDLAKSDPVSFWRMVLLKLLLGIGMLAASLYFLQSTPKIQYATEIKVTLLVLFTSFYIFSTTPKQALYISYALIFSIATVVLYTIFVHPRGIHAPGFPQLISCLVISFVLLGEKASAFLYLIFLGFLLFLTSRIENVGDIVTHEINLETMYIRMMTLTTVFLSLFILLKITKVVSNSLADQVSKKSLEENTDTLRRVASSFAHEINNPLAIVKGYTEMLAIIHEQQSSQEKSIHENIEVSVNRIQNIVHRFYSFFSVKPPEVNIVKLKSTVEASLRISGLEGKFVLNISEQTNIVTDKNYLVQIIEFLSQNAHDAALQAYDQGKVDKLHLEWSISGNKLSCIDNGLGFGDLGFENALKPFATTKLNKKSQGLGLFAVYLLCQRLGVDIIYERENS